jgi:hypothetical protein
MSKESEIDISDPGSWKASAIKDYIARKYGTRKSRAKNPLENMPEYDVSDKGKMFDGDWVYPNQ